MTCPCGVCEERFAGCHAECDAYKLWNAEQAVKRDKMNIQRYKDKLINDMKAASIAKQRRRKK